MNPHFATVEKGCVITIHWLFAGDFLKPFINLLIRFEQFCLEMLFVIFLLLRRLLVAILLLSCHQVHFLHSPGLYGLFADCARMRRSLLHRGYCL